MDSAASSAGGSSSLQPFIVFVVIAVIMVSSFIRAANRKKRAQSPVPGRTNKAHDASQQPVTLLNGVPLKSYDTPYGHQGTSFANERMRVEAELKRELDALDAARRAGQVDAEQYAGHRDAIFKRF